MKTRKEMNDKHGYRTIYVIEQHYLNRDLWAPVYDESGFANRFDAVKGMYREYKRCKEINSDWRRKDFRVVLYVRAE